MSDWYIYDENHKPIKKDVIEASIWLYPSKENSTDRRRVKKDTVNNHDISTVFLGLDHGYGEGEPVLWETMIFGASELDQWQDRYTSYEDALKGHEVAVELVKNFKKDDT